MFLRKLIVVLSLSFLLSQQLLTQSASQSPSSLIGTANIRHAEQ
jgi:hypothetical protein